MSHKEDGKVKVQVYQKATHTDQYLNFSFHYLLNDKLGVIHTLYDHYNNIVREEADAEKEINHVNRALGACCYLSFVLQESEGTDRPTGAEKQQLDQQDGQ